VNGADKTPTAIIPVSVIRGPRRLRSASVRCQAGPLHDEKVITSRPRQIDVGASGSRRYRRSAGPVGMSDE
jgi:hypothetical protein